MKVKYYDILFFTSSIINIVINLVFGMDYGSYFLLLYLILLLILKKYTKETFLLYTLFIPNKYLQIFAIPMYLMASGRLFQNRMKKKQFIFILYICGFGLLNCVIYDGFIISTIFQIGFYYCILKIINQFKYNFVIETIYETLDKMFVLQCIAIFIQVSYTKSIGDSVKGTLISAHYLGLFMCIYIFLTFKQKHVGGSKFGTNSRLVLSAALLWFSDAKHVLFAFFIAIIIVKILNLFKVKSKMTVSVLGIVSIVVIGVFLLNNPIVQNLMDIYPNIFTYAFNSNYNKKFIYFTNTFNEMKSWHGLFGFGVGQFGSQISLTMSKGIIYDWNSSLSAYKFAIPPFKNSITGLMTEWYINYGISISSMVLGYPLVSFVSQVAELGIVGLFILLKIFDEEFKNDNIIFLLTYFIMGIFDTYFEIPCIFILILIATLANDNKKFVISKVRT